MSLFETLNLKPELISAIQELGYDEPTEIQVAAIPALLSGQDILGQAQTGTGKTAAFALPMLQRINPKDLSVQGFILTPTRELALQVSKAFEVFAKFQPIKVLSVYGGQPYGKQLRMLAEGVQVVVGTPGRVLDLIQKKNALDLSSVRFLVIDEADEMLKMGFIEDVETILSEASAGCQKALFSATLPKEVRTLAAKYMQDAHEITIESKTLTVSNTEQRYYMVQERDKYAALIRLLEFEPVSNALIFARTKVRTGELAERLMSANYKAEPLHGDLSQQAREAALNRFRHGQTQLLVATDVAARGLDIEGVSHVFNYDLPFESEDFVHRIGRTGRAGASGTAISLVVSSELFRIRRIEKLTSQPMVLSKIPNEKEIIEKRKKDFEDAIIERLANEKYAQEIQLVRKLIDFGYDPVEIAAAGLQMVHEQKKYPRIESVGVVEPKNKNNRKQKESRSRRDERPGRGKAPSRFSHEKGMVRLMFGLGKADAIRPRMVVGAIANEAKIPGKAVGAINIQKHQTFVDVSEQYAEQVVRKLTRVEFNGKATQLKKS
jgi:ATP-dependent RNA helicase DeaD